MKRQKQPLTIGSPIARCLIEIDRGTAVGHDIVTRLRKFVELAKKKTRNGDLRRAYKMVRAYKVHPSELLRYVNLDTIDKYFMNVSAA